ncbi:amidase [Granulicella mallensis]|uniref:Amidase n=1 Tax=Granulicella mallensis (strain ATCC BAA-1857 / DSM 23137 / MP5ACTX8) TaxID=682795 RepID=G8NZV9_GRAMM|nr:amidase [Granulicella mallensis]AEU34586.1 Amidase [Granulicella mallensis MP5ACTX8]
MTFDANAPSAGIARRRFLAVSTAAGLGGTLFPGTLFALATRPSAGAPTPANGSMEAQPDLRGWPAITPEMIDAAAAIAAIKLTNEQKQMMLDGLTGQRNSALRVRTLNLANSVAPADVFNPVPTGTLSPHPAAPLPVKLGTAPSISGISASALTFQEDAVAFATVRQLGEALRLRKLTSVALTKMYLARLKRYDPSLHFVITLTEERALAQAAQADREIAAGKYRGPLHGIPWGAKDLLAVKGYPTTWGAAGFEQQRFDEDAEVVKRLDAAGAVLIAKLSMGALAQGDLWFGGRTRNPWNPRQGSSGSSAGSGSAVAAGCVGFAIGTETLGSISSPSTRCGATGLRPSFGLVPRTGGMALTWSMDKIGPIARSVEDCALVLNAIYGPDGRDQSVQPAPFHADLTLDIRKLHVGYLKSAFDLPVFQPLSAEASDKLSAAERADREQEHRRDFDRNLYDAKLAAATLDRLRAMNVTLTPVELPTFHFSALLNILEAEAAAAFDELTISGRDALLTGQKSYDWPNGFRTARFISAVDYIQAQRARTLAIAAMHKFFLDFDVIVTPSSGAQLTATNLCGQPAVIVPNGLRGEDAPPFSAEKDEWPDYGGPGTPVSITFLAPLYGEAKACALAAAYQQNTSFHRLHPKLA